MVFLLVMFFFFMRQLQASGGKAMSFGKSRARLLNESQNKVTFADVAGIDEAKDDCEEIIAFLKDPKKFQRLGGRIPKGVLLMGAPGTGKTLLARAIAGEAGVPFFSISGSDFVEMFVGVGASRVRDLFEQGKKHAPCIIFIDEIDAVGRHRGSGLGGGHDEREQTLNQLLVEMDGFESSEGVIIIAATNRPGRARPRDPASRSLRPPHPRAAPRSARSRRHPRASTPRRCRSPPTSISRSSAAARPGFSGADLENLVNEAALLAARQDKDDVSHGRLRDGQGQGHDGRRAPLHGHQRHREADAPPGTRPVTRWSGCMLPEPRPGPQGVDHSARSRAGRDDVAAQGRPPGLLQATGRSTASRWRSAAASPKRSCSAQLTTGAAERLPQATQLARAMVTEWGMSEKLGPARVRLERRRVVPAVRARPAPAATTPSGRRSEIDAEVRRIITEQYDACTRLLRGNMRQARGSSPKALLERETLDSEEIDRGHGRAGRCPSASAS